MDIAGSFISPRKPLSNNRPFRGAYLVVFAAFPALFAALFEVQDLETQAHLLPQDRGN